MFNWQKTKFFGVVAFMIRDNKILVARRSATEHYAPEHWEIVGGEVEWGESPENALRREVKEETGLEIENTQLYTIYDDINKKKRQHVIVAGYYCNPVGDTKVVLNEEHTEYRWITKEEVQHLQPMKSIMKNAILEGFKFSQNRF